MRIAIIASEAVPFAKTGGLADVAGALPRALERLGHQAAVILPCYNRVWKSGLPLRATGLTLRVPVGARVVEGHVQATTLPDSHVPAYLIDQPAYFDRDDLYGQNGRDYADNCERFVFFSRAALETVRLLDLQPDVLHCNDWQTGLIPVFLAEFYRRLPAFHSVGTLLTIHNLAYQGVFGPADLPLTGPRCPALQLAAARIPRAAQLSEGRAGVRRSPQRGQPDLCPRDPDPRVRLRTGRIVAVAQRGPERHRQRHRSGRLEPGERHVPGRSVRGRRSLGGQGRVQGVSPAAGELAGTSGGPPLCADWPA